MLILKARLVELAAEYKAIKSAKFVAATAEKAISDFKIAQKLVLPFVAKITAAAKGQAADFTAEEQDALKTVATAVTKIISQSQDFTAEELANNANILANAKGLQKVAERMGVMVGEEEDLTPCKKAEDYIAEIKCINALGILVLFVKKIRTVENITTSSIYNDHKIVYSSLTKNQIEEILSLLNDVDDTCLQEFNCLKGKKDDASILTTHELIINFIACEKAFMEFVPMVSEANKHILILNSLEQNFITLRSLNNAKSYLVGLNDSERVIRALIENFNALPIVVQTAYDNNFIRYWTVNLNKITNLKLLLESLITDLQKVQDIQNLHPLEGTGYWDTADAEPDLPKGAFYDDYTRLPLTRGKEAFQATDIKQGKINDCYLLSPIGAIASQSSAKIAEMISVVDKKKGIYKVKLYLPNEMGELKEVLVTINARLPNMPTNNRGDADLMGANSEAGELWVMLIEKAYAKAMGGYENINKPSDPALAYEFLTGKKTKTVTLKNIAPADYPNLFVKGTVANAAKKDTVHREEKSNAKESKGKPLSYLEVSGQTLYLEHSYYISAYENEQIRLRNPHGNSHLILDLVDFLYYFNSIVTIPAD